MRLVFAGTPEFARAALAALIEVGHEVRLVLAQPDRPAGRGLQLAAGPVKQLALNHRLPVAQPKGLRLDGKNSEDALAAKAVLEATPHDAMVVAAYGLILPQWVLNLPRLGAINIHASLLPRWRGAAPIHRAIEAGDEKSGISIMQMDAGLDTGPILLQRELNIEPSDDSGSLHDKLAALGGESIVEALARLEKGELIARPQPEKGAVYAPKITKIEAALDFARPAAELANKIRAFDPSPGCVATINGTQLKLFKAQALEVRARAPWLPGEIVAIEDGGIVVAAGAGLLKVSELQKPGGRRLRSADFLAGFRLKTGERFSAS